MLGPDRGPYAGLKILLAACLGVAGWAVAYLLFRALFGLFGW